MFNIFRQFSELIDNPNLLMLSMAKAMNIDMSEAINCDSLPVEDLNTMMKKCFGCPSQFLCVLFLEMRGGQIVNAPSYCPNRARLSELQEKAAGAKVDSKAPDDAEGAAVAGAGTMPASSQQKKRNTHSVLFSHYRGVCDISHRPRSSPN